MRLLEAKSQLAINPADRFLFPGTGSASELLRER
jgi:hypothetical protein